MHIYRLHFTEDISYGGTAMKKINIGILGFGNVGTGTYNVLTKNKDLIAKRYDVEIEVTKILARDLTKDRGIALPNGFLTSDPDEIIMNKDIDIVCEVLGGIEPATTFMLTAMKEGKHVVTANKAAVAANYTKLISAAKENNVEFRFEASVGGAIPILSSITMPLSANDFSEVLGIVNGTTNYILTQMSDYGLEYEDVLKKAQELGFAEADPTADVEGIDVANKLSILIALMFDTYIAPDKIPTTGITEITKDDIEKAKAEGKRIKLIASAKMEEGKLTYSVTPMALSQDHPLARVNNEFNAVYVTGNACDSLMFYGRGAGPLPTGSAVAGDVIMIASTIK